MALSLNTSHPLYADLLALIGVDDDNVIKDLTGNNACSPHANVVIGSGSYGRHFRTFVVSNNAQGVALAPGLRPKPTANPVCSIFVVINAGNSFASRGTVFDPGGNNITPAVYTGDVAGIQSGTSNPTLLGTTDLIGTGQHSFGAAWNGITGQLGNKVFADGVVENSSSANFGNASDSAALTYIGGSAASGYGGLAADYVWIAVFRRYLSDSEIAELHSSLGPGNVFSLIDSGSATTEISATLASVVGSVSSKAGSISSISAALANISGSLTSGSGSLVTTISATLANVVGALSSTGSTANGTFTSEVLKDYAGNVLASVSLNFMRFYNDTTGELVLNKTGVSTNASGIVTFSDGALVSGTTYRVDWETSAGSRRMPRKAAA